MKCHPFLLGLLLIPGMSNAETPLEHQQHEKKGEFYQCPMHPEVTSEKPGECPICHMKLIKVGTKNSAADNGQKKIKFYRHPMNPEITSPRPAKDDMGMDYIPVFEKPDGSSSSDVRGRAAFQLTENQQTLSGVTVAKVQSRTLNSELEVPGRSVIGNQVVFQVFEQDLNLLKSNLKFEASASSARGELFEGRITSIDSIIDPTTRTVRVNGVITKARANLRSESSLSGKILIPLGQVLTVPSSAVFHTGSEDLVFVTDGAGQFIPKRIMLGAKAGNFYEVKEGLAEGQLVSAGPNFLLDSESRIQAVGR